MHGILKDYLTMIGSIPVMDHESSISCFKALDDPSVPESKKNRIRTHIIESNLRLVISIAKTYKTSEELPFVDVIQEGNIGLMKAIERYKWKKGYRFSTYASWWIRQAISTHVSKTRRTVRLPSHAIGVQRRIMKAIEEYNDRCGIPPTSDELKEILSDVSDTVLDATLHAGMGTVSIHKTHDTDEMNSSNSLESKLHDLSPDPFQSLANSELLDIVMKVMNELPDKEAAVVRMRFGLYDAGLNREDYLIDEEGESNVIV